jgi:hypothetical protein
MPCLIQVSEQAHANSHHWRMLEVPGSCAGYPWSDGRKCFEVGIGWKDFPPSAGGVLARSKLPVLSGLRTGVADGGGSHASCQPRAISDFLRRSACDEPLPMGLPWCFPQVSPRAAVSMSMQPSACWRGPPQHQTRARYQMTCEPSPQRSESLCESLCVPTAKAQGVPFRKNTSCSGLGAVAALRDAGRCQQSYPASSLTTRAGIIPTAPVWRQALAPRSWSLALDFGNIYMSLE